MAIAVAFLLAVPAQAQVTPYSQDFEGLDEGDTGALAADGWLVFGLVFDLGFGFKYPYGPFGAPNDGGGFSRIVLGEGDAAQGAQQLRVFSDYINGDHYPGGTCGAEPCLIESNVFQEWVVTPGDVGTTWKFTFDVKRGDIAAPTTALAFIKTIDNVTFGLSNFVTLDTASLPDTWGTYDLAITIDPSLVGHFLQIGFLNQATEGNPSGMFYDNINFVPVGGEPVPGMSFWSILGLALLLGGSLLYMRRRAAQS